MPDDIAAYATYAMQHTVTGVILYTIAATKAEIDRANANLAGAFSAVRFVEAGSEVPVRRRGGITI